MVKGYDLHSLTRFGLVLLGLDVIILALLYVYHIVNMYGLMFGIMFAIFVLAMSIFFAPTPLHTADPRIKAWAVIRLNMSPLDDSYVLELIIVNNTSRNIVLKRCVIYQDDGNKREFTINNLVIRAFEVKKHRIKLDRKIFNIYAISLEVAEDDANTKTIVIPGEKVKITEPIISKT